MKIIKEEKKDFMEILERIKKKDFSGNTGLAVKNSVYQFSTTLIGKIGSLIFTIILARLLMPELFGLYSLALSTILLFTVFSDIGIGGAVVRFVSKELGKRNKKRAKAYVIYFGKIKLILVFISISILIFSSKFISDVFYQKPIFLALIAGSFYILFMGIVNFFSSILQASNYFRGIFYKEILFQISRIILVPLAILLALKYSLSYEYILFYIILFLSISYLFISLFTGYISIKRTDFIKTKKSKLTPRQNKKANKFLLAMSATVFSGLFFSYIDKIMLGYFILVEFIGYYTVALSLAGAVASLTGFGAVLLPIFSRLRKKRLQEGLKKSLRIILPISIILFLGTILLAPFAVSIIYGPEYNQAINILRLLSLLLIAWPLIGIYTVYFMSKGKPQVIAKLLIISTLINIALNYILITSLLKYGNLAATFGAATATIISQFFYLGGLIISKRKDIKKDGDLKNVKEKY